MFRFRKAAHEEMETTITYINLRGIMKQASQPEYSYFIHSDMLKCTEFFITEQRQLFKSRMGARVENKCIRII